MLWLVGIVFLEIDFKDDPLSTRGLIYLKQAYRLTGAQDAKLHRLKQDQGLTNRYPRMLNEPIIFNLGLRRGLGRNEPAPTGHHPWRLG